MTHPLKAVLEQVGPSSCPTTHNFHCHTICSDGSLEPLELIQQATERGLKHLAVTDHHSSHAHRESRPGLISSAPAVLRSPPFGVAWKSVHC